MLKHAVLVLSLISFNVYAEITRHPLPGNSTFPIAMAVEIPANTTQVFHSGMLAHPANPKAARGSQEFWGDTEAQTDSVFARLHTSLVDMGLSFGDVIKMTVFLVGVPKHQGGMDFEGFMRAYSKHFGTTKQPNLPARSVVQVAGLVAPGMLVEVEVILARTN